MTLPCENGEGARKCMEKALANAEINIDQVEYINAHGTSTPAGDIAETSAIKNQFNHADSLVVAPTKSMIGHLLGAAGGVEAIVTILSIQHQTIHPTINIFNQDPACDLDYNSKESRSLKITHALSNSFGFEELTVHLFFKIFVVRE